MVGGKQNELEYCYVNVNIWLILLWKYFRSNLRKELDCDLQSH